ncbi:oligosaccharide repeat unit polymerase [Rhodococcus sp. 27YEA15]|uniref:oligosaccharide repeat unit polymerase n=1 Tax=Rhodococcus sp. 27YEA15 TaxID=3156259 RepID=UPI003C7B9894
MSVPVNRRNADTAFTEFDAHRRASLMPPLVAVWTAVIMVVVVPYTVVSFTPSPPSRLWVMVLAVTTVAGLRYAWIVGEGFRRLVEMSFWVFTYVFMGLAPLAQLRMRAIPPTTPRVDPTLNARALIIVLVGIAAFLVGLVISAYVWRRIRDTRWGNPAGVRIDPVRVLILAACALVANAYYIKKLGVGTLLSSRSAVVEQAGASLGQSTVASIIGAVAMMSLLVAFIATVKYRDQNPAADRLYLLVIVVLGAVLLLTFNPISSARYLFGTAALAVAALFGLFATRARFRVVALLAVAALVLVFPLADAFRYSTSAQFKTSSPLESLTSPDYDAFAQVNNTVNFVNNHGVTDGKQALGVVLFWIPRTIWPGKATDTGILLAESRNYTVKNLSAPLWSELFINGGWIALILGMTALGVVAGVQDRRIEISLRQARAPTILACILPFYLIILLRGSLLQAMSYFLVIVGCALFVSRRERAHG